MDFSDTFPHDESILSEFETNESIQIIQSNTISVNEPNLSPHILNLHNAPITTNNLNVRNDTKIINDTTNFTFDLTANIELYLNKIKKMNIVGLTSHIDEIYYHDKPTLREIYQHGHNTLSFNLWVFHKDIHITNPYTIMTDINDSFTLQEFIKVLQKFESYIKSLLPDKLNHVWFHFNQTSKTMLCMCHINVQAVNSVQDIELKSGDMSDIYRYKSLFDVLDNKKLDASVYNNYTIRGVSCD